MRIRPRTLAGATFVALLGVQLLVLGGVLTAVRVLLNREIEGDLNREGLKYARVLASAVTLHGQQGAGALTTALEELEVVSGVPAIITRGSRVVYQSRRVSGLRVATNATRVSTVEGFAYSVSTATVADYTVIALVPREPFDRLRTQLTNIMVVCLAIGLLAGGLLAKIISQRLTAPLTHLAQTTASIDLARLDVRVDQHATAFEEIRGISTSFNHMLERLDAAVSRLRQFTAEAAHELRTPVAILKTVAQVTIADPSTSDDVLSLARQQLVQIDRLQKLVNDLLLLSKVDIGVGDRSLVDLGDVVVETVELLRPLAEARNVRLVVEGPSPVTVTGDRAQLESLVTNLIDNGVKYAGSDGTVTVNLRSNGAIVQLEVSDTGGGVAPADRDRIFEPFHRLETSRSRDTGGAGLGLTIVRRVANVHGGSVTVTTPAQGGCTFAVALPLASMGLT